MKKRIKFYLVLLFICITSNLLFSNSLVALSDSLKLIEQYSLFSEYHKNKDYKSALPFGWQVLSMDQKKFAKWIYYKMEDCLWWLHDSSDLTNAEKTSIAESMPGFYEMAFENYPDATPFFQAHKAFVFETWLNKPVNEIILEYELAAQVDPDMDPFYYDRLGELLINNSSENNDFKSKAIQIYTMLSEKHPEDQRWATKLEVLVENINQLVDLAKKNWDSNPEDENLAWRYAALALKANRYTDAITALEFLVSKSPEEVDYWAQLAIAYQKSNDLTKAETIYKKLIQLEPNKKENYLNLGIVYKNKGQFSAARSQYQKANEVGKGWALPVYYEGNLYEQSARGCEFDFDAKLIFLLAVETYRRARNMDSSMTQARERINALSVAIPSKEDYSLRGFKSGDSIPIGGKCSAWIGRSIIVP